MDYQPLHFFGEPIEVLFTHAPALEKKPGSPNAFIWRGEVHRVKEVVSEWHHYQRHGRMANNMRPEHAVTATRRGSWGVGQDYFRVETIAGRYFDIYYDRAPKNVDDRKGAWFLDKEVTPAVPSE